MLTTKEKTKEFVKANFEITTHDHVWLEDQPFTLLYFKLHQKQQEEEFFKEFMKFPCWE
jgi:hypothetical protein